jgi:hypothetical protein
MSMTLDGFVSDLDGSNKWMYGSDPKSKAWAVETSWNASLPIMGSRSFGARVVPAGTGILLNGQLLLVIGTPGGSPSRRQFCRRWSI